MMIKSQLLRLGSEYYVLIKPSLIVEESQDLSDHDISKLIQAYDEE